MDDARKLLTMTYAKFNARDLEGVLRTLDADVDWPNGMEGGRVRGRDGVREYWTRQWGMVDRMSSRWTLKRSRMGGLRSWSKTAGFVI